MNRPRACAAIIKDNKILMVHIVDGKRDFWTLPGGGLEDKETYKDAVIREVKEEVNLDVEVMKYLFTSTYRHGEEKCYLVKVVNDKEPTLGYDPEYSEDNQVLKSIEWKSLEEVKNDLHVEKVLRALNISL